jgi:putative methionine-R-sulfoxide reductase with GAF domain
MGDDLMRKADLLDELRSEIGVVSDKCLGNIGKLYQFVCDALVEKVSVYQSVSIYLAESTCFRCHVHTGSQSLPDQIPFGEGFFSIAAVQGSVVREKMGDKTEIFVPFYQGHHLIGELVVVSIPHGLIDDEDISLFCELASLFETKVKEFNS